jgi:hypothetical protein
MACQWPLGPNTTQRHTLVVFHEHARRWRSSLSTAPARGVTTGRRTSGASTSEYLPVSLLRLVWSSTCSVLSARLSMCAWWCTVACAGYQLCGAAVDVVTKPMAHAGRWAECMASPRCTTRGGKATTTSWCACALIWCKGVDLVGHYAVVAHMLAGGHPLLTPHPASHRTCR